jgi:AcrR family transcriptional regulator
MSKIDTIDSFIASFLSLCGEKPFTQISMREVARNTQFSHTLLLKYFPTKNDLLISSYAGVMKKNIPVYDSAGSLGELACALIETWEDNYRIVDHFSTSFSEDPALSEAIYNQAKYILLKPMLRLCNGDRTIVESYYTLLISISFYPFTMIKNKEAKLSIEDYKKTLLKVYLK